MTGAAILKIGEGFGTWLIPIIIFGILGSVAVVSLILFVCLHQCRPRRKITDQEPEMTYETYRTPTTPYKDPSLDRPVDPTIGRLITHSRSLHVPRNQLINGHRLRPQVSSPELRNTSRPPPYMYRAMPLPSPFRNPRPFGQVYLDHIVDTEHQYHVTQQPQRPTSPENRSERSFSVTSPSSYSSTCMSAEASFTPSAPSIFSQESFVPVRALSWVDFPEPRELDSDSSDLGSLLTPPSHNELSAASPIPDSYETEKFPTARPRRRSETGGRSGLSRQNNRRLIIVDNNLVSGNADASPDRVEVSRLVGGILQGREDSCATAADSTPNEEETSKTKEGQIEKPPAVRKKARDAVFKVICPDTSDLWKMPVIPDETLDGFAGRVKQKTGGDVILFVGDEVLASEEDWKAARGGGRIVAHLIR